MAEEQEFSEEEQELYDAADPKTVNSARKREVRLRQKRLNFVRRMMEDEEGRLWIADLLAQGHHSQPTHVKGDPFSSAFQEGERNIINKILYDLTEAGVAELTIKATAERDAEK